MNKVFVFDTRLPVSPNTSESDPAHPKNVMKTTRMIENQALADTKYDIYPPPRVEGFALSRREIAMTVGSVVIALLSIAMIVVAKYPQLRMLFVFAAIVSTHYAIGRLEKLTA